MTEVRWPAERILEMQEKQGKDITRILTVLVGVEGTDIHGLAGDVSCLQRTAQDHDRRLQSVEENYTNNHADKGDLGIDSRLLRRWLIVAAGMGAFVAGALVALGDRFNLW